jgi:hypothetical protein
VSDTYEPELGQMLFGNATGEYECPDLVADELYALSEALGKRSPDAQAHGVLGGGWGYGQDFTNDTFSMLPYWWGDCTCGYDALEYEWWNANPHDGECWQERYHREAERLHALKLSWEAERDQQDAWAATNGWDGRPGVAVFCDCGADAKWREWASSHGHTPDCMEIRPNFRCGDVEVRWYKYIGRGMSVNREVTRAEWRDIFARCEASLGATA